MENLSVVYDSLTFYKIMHWVEKAGRNEISGFGNVIKEGSVLKVVDAILLPQKNGAAHTDIEPEAVGKAEYQLRHAKGEMRLWWHSHVEMQCFWSKTDTDTIEALGKHGWILATVFNQHWRNRSAVYIGSGTEVFIDDIPTRHVYAISAEQAEIWDKEFTSNVEVTVYKAPAKSDWVWEGGKWRGGAWRDKEEDALTIVQKKKFRGWLKNAMKDLTKRERELINGSKADPVLAIMNTKDFGKVVWRESDDKEGGMYLTTKEAVHIKQRFFRMEIFTNATKFQFMKETMLSRLEYLLIWRELTPAFREIVGSTFDNDAIRRISTGGEEEEIEEQLAGEAIEVAHQTEMSEIDEAILEDELKILSPADLSGIRKAWPHWDDMEADEKVQYIDFYKSERMIKESAGGYDA